MRVSRRAFTTVSAFLAVILLSVVFLGHTGPYAHSSFRVPLLASRDEDITSRVFLLLKTGIEVAYSRLPAHVETTLKRYPTHAVYGDAARTISGVDMIDCLEFVDNSTLQSDSLLAYRLRREAEVQGWNWGSKEIHVAGKKTGWDLDKFKNVPAFAHAWTQDSTKDWYVMIDADSYIFADSLQAITAKYNPDDRIYLGKAVNGMNPFAHGGSGIVLSRGSMLAIYGDSKESMEQIIEAASRSAQGSCCGDLVLAASFTAKTGLDAGLYLDRTELGQFQGAQVPTVLVPANEQWCRPAPTFHEVTPWEVYLLDEWETNNKQKGKNLTYAQYYNDFIKLQVVPELQNWVFHDGNFDGADIRAEISRFEQDTSQAKNKAECIRQCESEPDCLMWTFLSGELCKNFHNVVSVGSKMNMYNPKWKQWPEVASGYMVDRITAFRKTQWCENVEEAAKKPTKGSTEESTEKSTHEGWFIDQLKEKGELQAEGLAVLPKKLPLQKSEVPTATKPPS